MRVVSVNVGLPRTVSYQGRKVRTGIFKEPVTGSVPLTLHGLEGDGQADLKHHGGPDQTVYAHPWENYPRWRQELEGAALEPGALGENLTLEGLPEDRVHVGDVVEIGGARLVVTMPREPCYKLGLRVGSAAFVKTFLESCRVGYYLRALSPGVVAAGQPVTVISEDPARISVAELTRLRYFRRDDTSEGLRTDLEKACGLADLAPLWRDAFERRLHALGST